jgi:hypothetical protein
MLIAYAAAGTAGNLVAGVPTKSGQQQSDVHQELLW